MKWKNVIGGEIEDMQKTKGFFKNIYIPFQVNRELSYDGKNQVFSESRPRAFMGSTARFLSAVCRRRFPRQDGG
jgi:hypothetical protein